MFLFTLVFGLLGLHHLLLRSPQTMLFFLLGNFLTLGYWWFYDLIQLSPYGGNTTETLNTYGLSHPWGPLGVAQGMWMDDPGLLGSLGNLIPSVLERNTNTNTNSNTSDSPFARQSSSVTISPLSSDSSNSPLLPPPRQSSSIPMPSESTDIPLPPPPRQQGGGNPPKQDDGPPNPFWFFSYALLLFVTPLAAYLAGDKWLALDKFGYLTVIPFGWALSVFSVLYDYWILFFQTGDLCVTGAKRFFPFPFFQDPDGHSSNLTGKKEFKGCPPDNVLQTGLKFAQATTLPLVKMVSPATGALLDAGITAATVAKDTAVSTVEVGTKVAHLAAKVPVAAAKGIASAGPKALEVAKDAAKEKLTASVQLGGGRTPVDTSSSFNAVDVIGLGTMGALIVGGMVLSLGRTLRGHYVGPSDAPPLA